MRTLGTALCESVSSYSVRSPTIHGHRCHFACGPLSVWPMMPQPSAGGCWPLAQGRQPQLKHEAIRSLRGVSLTAPERSP